MKTIIFAGITYITPNANPAQGSLTQKEGTAVEHLSGPELVELYNLVSANLGRGRVKRFASQPSGVERTWKLLEEYAATGSKEIEEAPAPKVKTAKQKGRAQTGDELLKEKGAVTHDEFFGEVPGYTDTPPVSVLVPADKPKAPKVEDKAAAAAPATKVERWRTPKSRPASKICYKPRPGSKQAKAYELLTQDESILVEDFCSEMSKLDTSGKNSTEWKEPGTIWGGLNYLFVTQKGYGLEFDGERIRLIIGEEERDPSSKAAS